uniref:Notch ligand N-terminal domain-containing protein n=1 Tax=Timema monikensis TaxID=170555 RepID=A0A7R9HNA7_9NEOP|nr:unnamed protein product [Timema monikensis]
MRWIPAHAGYTSVLVVLLAALQQGGCSGVFELRLKSFVNDYGKDSVGQCCSGEPPAPGSGLCSGPCRTRFRVCLKHYQAQIDTTSPCTFGDVMTPVLGENSVHLTGDSFDNLIRFPFDFTWPVSPITALPLVVRFTVDTRTANLFYSQPFDIIFLSKINC